MNKLSKTFIIRTLWGPLGLVSGLVLCFLTAPRAYSRDLQGRLGVGFNSEFANAYANGFRIPGASVKYALTRDIAVEGILGIATTTPSNSVVAAKIFKTLFFETNLNFYSMAGLGLINVNSLSGIQLITGFGVEFFMPGLESLGFSMETGISFDNATGSYAIHTLGFSFLDAGIHFYF
jgi:hypothetical protein